MNQIDKQHKREENLKYLINQTEERIKLVDTKASIIIAFFGFLLSNHDFFQKIYIEYQISILFCHYLVLLLFLSFVFLLLTIRPVKKWSIIWDYKKRRKKKEIDDNPVSFWIENSLQADNFDIGRVNNSYLEFQNLFKALSKKRILKYRYFRISMWLLRMVMISLIPCLIYILFYSM